MIEDQARDTSFGRLRRALYTRELQKIHGKMELRYGTYFEINTNFITNLPWTC